MHFRFHSAEKNCLEQFLCFSLLRNLSTIQQIVFYLTQISNKFCPAPVLRRDVNSFKFFIVKLINLHLFCPPVLIRLTADHTTRITKGFSQSSIKQNYYK